MVSVACSKCGSEMEPGFVASRSLDYTKPDDWVAGAPEHSIWFGTKVRDRPHHRIESMRCTRCGFLELYARGEGQD